MASAGERPPILLQEDNYQDWRRDIRAVLRGIGALGIVDGTVMSPSIVDDESKLDKWHALSDKAASLILRSLSANQYVHVNEDDTPHKMWIKLEEAHNKKLPATRFTAYNDLFNIHKDDDESLSTLMSRVDKAIGRIKSLRPADYSLSKLDDELASLALIRALPQSESLWTSSLLMSGDITYDKVKTHFATQDTLQKSRGSESAAKALTPLTCTFCGATSHNEETCYAKQNASRTAKEQVKQRLEEHASKPKKKGKKKNTAAKTEADEDNTNNNQEQAELAAGNASIMDVTSPLCALIVEASSDWTADTGASSHMIPHRHWFVTYSPYIVPIKLADGKIIKSAGVGSVRFKPHGKKHTLEFQRVLHVPDLKSNLLSILFLTALKGFRVEIVNKAMLFYRNGDCLFTATVNSNNTALLDGITLPMTEYADLASTSTCPMDTSLWHRRFGHLNIADVKQLISRNLVLGMDVNAKHAFDPICEPCLNGKQTRHINKVATTHHSEPLALIHSDVHGPLKVQTPEGYKYWVTFIDDASRYCSIALIKHKSDVFTAFKQFKAVTENQLGYKVKMLRDDKGGEYMSQEFDKYLANAGISRQHTVRNSPHQNGVAERFNRTLAQNTISMMSDAKLPLSFWGYTVLTAVYLRNRSPTSALDGKVPYTCFTGKVPDVSHLRVFGCTVYVHVQKDQRSNLGAHTQKCVFIGYPAGYKGWQFYNPLTRKTLISDSVTFDERAFPGLSRSPPVEYSAPYDFLLMDNESAPVSVPVSVPRRVRAWIEDENEDDEDLVEDDLDQVGVNGRHSAPAPPSPGIQNPVIPPTSQESTPTSSPSPAPAPVRRSNRVRRPPQPFWLANPLRPALNQYREPTPAIPSSDEEDDEEVVSGDEEADASPDEGPELSYDEDTAFLTVPDAFEIAYKAAAHDNAPQTLAEALRSPEADKWYDAAYEEIKALVDNGTWTLAKLPPGRKAIGCRWVFLVKHKKDGSIDRFKARLVAKGYAQRPGFDFTETFAPTAC